MEKVYLIFFLMPFILGSASFFWEKILNRSAVSFGCWASLLWILVSGFFVNHFYLMDMEFFIIGGEYLTYAGFPVGAKVNFLNFLFSIINSVLLFLTIIFLGGKDGSGKAVGICVAFVMMGVVNCALMAKSLYTFFILSEIIFFDSLSVLLPDTVQE